MVYNACKSLVTPSLCDSNESDPEFTTLGQLIQSNSFESVQNELWVGIFVKKFLIEFRKLMKSDIYKLTRDSEDLQSQI